MCAERPLALLVNPPIYDFALYDLYLKPYGLLKLGAWLEAAGWDVRFVDGMDYHAGTGGTVSGRPRRRADGTGKFQRQIVDTPPAVSGLQRRYARYGLPADLLEKRVRAAGADRAPELVLIGSGMTYWYPGVVEASRLCRRVMPRVPVVVGGVYATLLPAHARSCTEADHVAAGPAELTLPAILEDLGLPAPPAELPERTLPIRQVWADAGVLRLNRGCPFHCSYCASGLVSGGFAAGSPDAAFDECERMHRLCGTRNFAFYDDALLHARETVLLPFLERTARTLRDISFYVPNAVHVASLDGPSARLMLKAGFRELRLGYESSSEAFHAEHDGKLGPGDLSAVVQTLFGAGFRPDMLSVYVLAGLPGQPAAEVEQSIRVAAATGVRVHLAEYSPVPGTGLWKDSVARSEFPLEDEPLFHNNSFFPLAWRGFSRDDLGRLKRLTREL